MRNNETKFTKGEWVVDFEPCDQTMRVQIKFGDIEIMSVTPWFDENPPLEESISNAHLIAAAPEMYAMLDRYATTLDFDGYKTDDIKELLAKARGEK